MQVGGAVQGIAELITRPGLINVDFADVRTVMAEMGMAMIGSGVASGPDRAREAAEAAVSSPLLEDINLAGANGVLVNVTAGMDLSIGEFQEVGETVKQFASDDATVVIGTVVDPDMVEESTFMAFSNASWANTSSPPDWYAQPRLFQAATLPGYSRATRRNSASASRPRFWRNRTIPR